MMSARIVLFLLASLLASSVVCNDNVINIRGIYGNWPPYLQFADIEVDLTTSESEFIITQNISFIPGCDDCEPELPLNTVPFYSPATNLYYVFFAYTLNNVSNSLLWTVDIAANTSSFINITSPEVGSYTIYDTSFSFINGSWPLYLYLVEPKGDNSLAVFDGVHPALKIITSLPKGIVGGQTTTFLKSTQNNCFYFTGDGYTGNTTLSVVSFAGELSQQVQLTTSEYQSIILYDLVEVDSLYGVFSTSHDSCYTNNYTLEWFVGKIDVSSGNVEVITAFPSIRCAEFLYPVISAIINPQTYTWSILLPLYVTNEPATFTYYEVDLETGKVLETATFPFYPIEEDYAYYQILNID
eukprot:TRINITY_DN105_c0_g1_i4.p1 TRINITY_DN105_c0_g1~~TRINITY_DN105_c0_g1_i4.p1  ORF type:complete len:355 (-),score=43.34 TRINITY_DN105_c0_g1_i4:147-1211(-)